MINMLSFALQNIIFQLILVATIGALLGETLKEIKDDEPLKFSKFIAEWISSGFIGVTAGLIIKSYKDEMFFIIGVTGIISFQGYQSSSVIFNNIASIINSLSKKH